MRTFRYAAGIVLAAALFGISAAGARAGTEEWFSKSIRSLAFGQFQDPSSSSQNPGNAFLDIPRYTTEFDLRPDFFVDTSLLSASFKPRIAASYRWWEDGVTRGERDGRAQFFVNEWMIQVKPTDRLFLSFGKEKMLWGASFLVSPSNILFIDTEKANPKSEVEGKYMATVVYLPNNAVTITGLGETQKQQDPLGRETGPERALKVDVMGGSYAASVVGYFRQHDRFRLGSFGQWTASDAVVLYYDGILSKGTDVRYPVADPAAPFGAAFTQPWKDSSRIFATVDIGGSYTFLSGETINLEYLFNGPGYSDAEARAYYDLRRAAADRFFDPGLSGLSRLTLDEALHTGSSFLRKHYVMAQVQKRDIKDVLDVSLRYLYSLEENSGQASSILEWRAGDRFSVYNINTAGVGGADSEFKSLIAQSYIAGIELHF